MQIVLILILLSLGHFLVDFMLGVWAVYKTMTALDLGLAGMITAACGLAGEGSQFLTGNLTDRGYRKVLVTLGVLFAAANGLLAYTENYFLLFVLLLATCLGSGAFHPSAVALAGSLTEKQKGLFISIFATGGALGLAISQIVFAKTHTYFEGGTVALIIPTLLLVMLLGGMGFWKKESHNENRSQHASFGFSKFREFFQDPALRMLYLAQVGSQTIIWGTLFILPDVLLTRGYDLSIAYGGGHFAFVIGGALTMIPSGYLADNYSVRSVLIIACTTGMLLFFSFLWIPELSTTAVLLLLLGSGSVLGIIQPLAVALGNQLRPNNPGMVSAFTMGLVWCVSEMFGPLGSGILSKLFTDDAPAKSLMVLGMLFIPVIYAVYRLPHLVKEPTLASLQPNRLE